MRTVWFRELCCYAESDICQRMGVSWEKGRQVIEQLMNSNIMRRVRKRGALDGEVFPEDMDEIFTDDERYLTFTFVGILMLDDIVIRCYPKYLKHVEDGVRSETFNQVLAVIRKYEKTRDQHIVKAASGKQSDNQVSFLAVIMELIEQYQKNGFYRKQETIEEINGMGDIDWEKTVHETQTLLSHGRPFYPDMYTKQSMWDEMNFFYCLHQCIISECFDVIEKADLGDFLGIRSRYRFDIRRNVLGEDDYLLRRIEQELTRQFVTSKRQMLQLMHLYLTRQGKKKQSRLLFYGTNAMNLVWETACGAVVGNQLQIKVRNIQELAGEQLRSFPAKDKSLLQLIDRPEWVAEGCGIGEKKDTLIPDSIRIRKDADGRKMFAIYDAKYYNIVFMPNRVSGQPGIESITKQYLYHLAYGALLKHFQITRVQNTFLFPSESGSKWLGRVTMPMLRDVTGTDVRSLALDASMVFQYYLDDKELPIEDVVYHGYTYESPAS